MGESSLYLELGEPVEAEWARGRTEITRTNTETIDRDIQMLPLELLGVGDGRGQTSITFTKETVDNDRETTSWLEFLASV